MLMLDSSKLPSSAPWWHAPQLDGLFTLALLQMLAGTSRCSRLNHGVSVILNIGVAPLDRSRPAFFSRNARISACDLSSTAALVPKWRSSPSTMACQERAGSSAGG